MRGADTFTENLFTLSMGTHNRCNRLNWHRSVSGFGRNNHSHCPSDQAQDFSHTRFGLFSFPIPKITILNPEIGLLQKSFCGREFKYMADSFHGHNLSKSGIQGGLALDCYPDMAYPLCC
ncbi:hypothetical protein [Caballeronia sp.]|uniref:hypothetical protein n=1 Tax=Caballeronia sp. TaxID=1931223 RepID=UPI003C57CE61